MWFLVLTFHAVALPPVPPETPVDVVMRVGSQEVPYWSEEVEIPILFRDPDSVSGSRSRSGMGRSEMGRGGLDEISRAVGPSLGRVRSGPLGFRGRSNSAGIAGRSGDLRRVSRSRNRRAELPATIAGRRPGRFHIDRPGSGRGVDDTREGDLETIGRSGQLASSYTIEGHRGFGIVSSERISGTVAEPFRRRS